MNNEETWGQRLENKFTRRNNKIKPKMKVHGKKVLELKKIIIKKSK
jgi:hypothetical protein